MGETMQATSTDAGPARAGPLVSVIVPSFNHARYIGECIDSVLAQDYAPIEIIVVDDGSSDGSVDILKAYGERITLLQQRGGRQARARNLALGVARGELVAFLDSDDRYLPGRIRCAVEAFRDDPAAGLVWADYRLVGADGALTSEARWTPRARDFRRELIAGNPICNATVTVRRTALDEIGGFDERMPRACDAAAWYQIAARGHRFVHLDRLVLDYRIHGTNDSTRFAPMTHERDLALMAGAQAYVRFGLIGPAGDTDRTWLRNVLLRQFSFRAAAWVQRQRERSFWNESVARLCETLGSDTGLKMFARMRSFKHLLSRRGAT